MIKLPPHLTLELTAKCNYACPYCYCVWHKSGKRPPRDRSTDQWKKILDRCAEDGVKSLSFSGGEPLLRKDLRELIRYAKKLLPDARLDLFTNNSRMKEDDFFFFKE
ncbi:MAG: radical SAM protein, partial [Lentisphaeria bacterium]|nr:radical SAM protein [Lentisphaeria bacterium]